MQIVNLNHVLNLVRHQAQKLPAVNDPFPMTEERALALIESAALLIGRACRAPSEMLTRISDHAARCQSHRQMDTHCGACQEYDKAHVCDLDAPGEKGDTCAA